jgi:hypothetical protein
LASAIFAAFSSSAVDGVFVGSPTAGDAPPGGCEVGADEAEGGALALVDCSVDEAGTVVPLCELPEGALPVCAAWLSGVGREADAPSGGGGRLPASVLSKPGLALLSSVRGDACCASRCSGCSAAGGLGGCVVSSAISSYDYTLTAIALWL